MIKKLFAIGKFIYDIIFCMFAIILLIICSPYIIYKERKNIKKWFKELFENLKKSYQFRFDMYNKLTLASRRNPKFKTMEEAEEKLRALGNVEFVNLTPSALALLKNASSPKELIYQILCLNHAFTTQRISKRFKKVVSSGNSDHNTSTNRSMVDIYLIVLTYRPEYTLRQCYEGLAALLEENGGVSFSVCSTINKAVYNIGPWGRTPDPKPRMSKLYRGMYRMQDDELNMTMMYGTYETQKLTHYPDRIAFQETTN